MESYEDVVCVDGRLLPMVNAFDITGIERALVADEVQACGATALVTALRFAERRGGRGASVLSYTNSGDVTGQRHSGSYTVGYMAAAAYR
jgi:hypothetical protein